MLGLLPPFSASAHGFSNVCRESKHYQYRSRQSRAMDPWNPTWAMTPQRGVVPGCLALAGPMSEALPLRGPGMCLIIRVTIFGRLGGSDV